MLYTYMYLKELLPMAFIPAFFGGGIFVVLCWNRKIYAESALQLFYVGMAVYGYFQAVGEWRIEHWGLAEHIPYLALGIFGVAGTGFALQRFTDAERPYLDAFTTVFSLIATWLMVNFIHENWLYWIIIDAVAIFLYYQRQLYFGAALFVIYLVMAIDGYWEQITIF
ncbi:nicotinamide riboside transporter PnuC [Sanyastnella coralliicola]|uniref:nicotinamide riboside transporter PnuC n=1 Tax=Sanyastnella coralliicola TaxID=3069118 RepID=UPI0027B99E6D|nr:nicotinamide riboside transporter PnuC [Longitalea sp. SCSIO 12813]